MEIPLRLTRAGQLPAFYFDSVRDKNVQLNKNPWRQVETLIGRLTPEYAGRNLAVRLSLGLGCSGKNDPSVTLTRIFEKFGFRTLVSEL